MSRLHRQKIRQVRAARALGAELGVPASVDVTERSTPAPIAKPARAKRKTAKRKTAR